MLDNTDRCQCGAIYMSFMFGNKFKIDNKWYKENALRFAALTTHCKLRFSFGEKLDVYFGLPMMNKPAFKRCKDLINDTSKVLAEKYMNEAVEEAISDKLNHGAITHCSMDGSFISVLIQI